MHVISCFYQLCIICFKDFGICCAWMVQRSPLQLCMAQISALEKAENSSRPLSQASHVAESQYFLQFKEIQWPSLFWQFALRLYNR